MKEWRNSILFVLFFAGSLVALRSWRTHQLEQAAQAEQAVSDSLLTAELRSDSAKYQTAFVTGVYDTTAILQMAQRVLKALQEGNYQEVSRYVDADSGLRFAPYAFVSDDNVVLTKPFLADPDTTLVQTWGVMDGSGDSIQMNLKAYHKRFVCDRNFLEKGEVRFNSQRAYGNSLNNLKQFCPDCLPVSYFHPGTERYGGMDWKELKIVFRPIRGKWKLVALVHDEWTI
ncbi:MAG: hypothetical protein H6606_10725 [Flavobacteriales bacterium]|nr:hypothetical protein [Flavobacteriales bacterium]